LIHNFVSKLSDNEKKIFYATVVIVLLALFDRLFLGPATDKLKSIGSDIEQEKTAVTQDMRLLSYEDKIMKENDIFSKFYTDTVEDDYVVNGKILSRIEALAKESKVNLVKSNPSEKKLNKDYIEYYATLDCVGTLEDVMTFMHMINSSDDLLKIVKYTMTPKRGTDEVTASMTVMKMVINPKITNDVSAK
jgi:hypothetical protein